MCQGDGDVRVILEEELDRMTRLKEAFPVVGRLPLINDEADPLKGKQDQDQE